MTNWDNDRTRLLHYLLEGFLVLLVLCGYLLTRFPEVALGFYLLYLIGGVMYGLFIKVKKDITLGTIVLFSPVVILVGIFILQLSLPITLFFVAYLVWRVLGHFREIDHENEIFIFSISLLIGLLEFIYFESRIEGKYIFIILLLQLFLTILIKLNRMYVEMKRQGDPSSKKFAIWGFGTTGALSGFGLILVLFYPYIQATIFFIFRTVISIIAYIVMYPISLLLAYFNPSIDPEKLEFLRQSTEGSKADVETPLSTDGQSDPTVLLIIAALITVILIAIYFFKKIDYQSNLNPVYANNVNVLEDGSLDSKFGQRKKYPMPTDEIRKRFYTFENLMIKYEFGRKAYEPVSDWLKRIEFTDVDVADVKSLYEKVRYGEMDLSNEEKQHYYKLMDEFTAIAKERYKENKKKLKAKKEVEKNSKQGNSIAKQIKENKQKNRDKYDRF